MHRLYGAIRFVLVLAPALLLAAWGLSYVRACWNVVLAPGVPVRLEWKTPGGNLKFTAASYSFNPRSGFLAVNRPELKDPEGRRLAAANLADVTGIDLVDITQSGLHIHLFGASGTLVRDPDGRFELQEFLGGPKSKARPVPFDVAIDRADVLLIDRKGGSEWTRTASFRDINVAGIGPHWVAGGDVELENAGSGRISVSHLASGDLALRTVASNWTLADLGRHLLSTLPPDRTRSVEPIEASTVTLSGPVEVMVPAKGEPEVRFDGSLDATGVRLRGYAASNLKFAGRVTAGGAAGAVTASAPGESAQLTGWVDWRNGRVTCSGSGSAKLASLDALPAAVRKQLPSGVFGKDVTFAGTTTFDPRTGFGADGTFTASRGGFREDALDGIRGRVRVGGTSVWTHVNAARYGAAKVSGEVAVDWKTKGISGAVRGDNIPVDKALERFPDLRGKIKGSPVGQFKGFAVLSGTTDRTDVAFRVIGSGSYAEADLPRVVKIDRAIAEGRYHDGAIALDRLRARTPAGTIGAQGSIDVRGKRLNLTVDGRGLDVGDFTTSLTGLASIVGDVDGTFDAPRFVGQLEGYDLGYQGTNLALLTAQLNATPKVIDATRLEVVVGSSQIGGHVALDLPSKRISGSFGSRALQIGDLLGDQYAGLVSLQSGELVGTYDDPRFTLTVTGKDLLAQELQVSSVEAFGDFRGRKLTLETLKAVAANGAVSATGDYDLDASAGHVSLTGSKLDLGAIMPSLQKTDKTALAGSVGGTANLAFAEKSITAVTATGTVAGLRANGTVLGDGVWNVSGDGHRLKGSAQASFGTRFLALENAALDLDAETLSSDVVASNLTLQNIYQFALPYLSNPGSDSNQQLALFDGDVKLIGHLDGKWSDPDLLVTSLQTDKLSYNGVGLGNLAASGSRVKGVWNVAGFDLVDGAARASARGVIDEAGETRLDGEIHNFDITKLAGAFPGLPPIGGVVSSSFLATGPTDHPQVRATLDAESVALEGHRVDFGANFDSITVGSAGIDAAGAVTYEGFHGQLVAHVPFAYPFSVPQGMPITAKLTLNQRPLSDLAPYAASIDPKRAQGAINGALALTGDRDSLHLSGGINIRAAEVGFRAVDPASKPGAPKYLPLATELKDLVFSLGVQDSALTADISAKSSQAGSIDGQISSKMAALDELLNGRTFADLDTWLSSPLSGKLAVNGLSVKESNKLATSSFALNGNLTVDGSLASPAIAGNVAVNNLNTTIPAVTSQPGTSTPPLIDPKFNIGFELQNPGHIGTGLASIDLMGRGRIGGSLSQLDASAALGVVRGELRLPGGRVTLDPGGVVRPSYQVDANGTSEARVQVELFGDSHVTAVRNGDIAERYDVHLDVHGDLLLPDQVVFTATSDPPDLTQDQILALLGRTDLLNALGSNTGYGQGERQFQTAALGYALPSLFDPITSRLAAGLGLDYLNVEYSALDQTSILAAKNLGHGFSFQVRRQVSLPTPGLPLTYDYRLVYQLPTRSRIIRRFSLFFGQDERTPWKLGLQYGTRL